MKMVSFGQKTVDKIGQNALKWKLSDLYVFFASRYKKSRLPNKKITQSRNCKKKTFTQEFTEMPGNNKDVYRNVCD